MTTQLNPNVQFRSLVGDLSDTVDEAILHALESSASDQLLATLAEARGGVVRMNHALNVVTISLASEHNHTLPQGAVPKPLEMPKLQKQPKPKGGVQRPGIAKLKKSPLDFMCPTCKAEPHTRCFVMTGPGNDSKVTDERRSDNWTHNKRTKLSSDHNAAAIARYDKEHFDA
jgi:hypothetical protein